MKALEEAFYSIIATCKKNFHLKYLGLPRKWLTPKLEQQVVPAKSARRKECDHVRSAFQFYKQSHVTEIVNVCHHNQLPLLSLNSQSRSTCFGGL